MRKLALLIPINKDGKVLLQHRTKDARFKPDHWAFFGGHIEEGESPEIAARREFQEELQIKVERLIFLSAISFKMTPRRLKNSFSLLV